MHIDLQQIINFLSAIPPDQVVQLLGGALGVSAVQQVAKTKIETETRKLTPGTNVFVTVALVAVVTAFAQLDGLIATDPGAFGVTGVTLYTITHLVYKLGIKPFSTWFGALLDDARALRQQRTAAGDHLGMG